MTDFERIWQNFLRQRRNLVAISAALVFIKLAKLHFDSKLMFFGNHILIGQPKAIIWSLWTVFIYWFYRYYVYFNDISDKGYVAAHRTKLRDMARSRAVRNYERRTGNKVDRTIFKTNIGPPPEWRSWGPGRYIMILKYPVYDRDGSLIEGEEEQDEKLQDWEITWLSILTHFSVGTNSHYFTEYVFPMLAAFVAVIIWLIF